MSSVTLFNIISLALAATLAAGQTTSAPQTQATFPAVALADKHFQYPDGIPYQVDTDKGLIRGTQLGYNRCNSSTENQKSLCQTAIVNDIKDFCLWAPPKPNTSVGESEGEMVAWCSKKGHGTRLMPAGTLTGVQVLNTPHYVQIAGYMNQSSINLPSDDYGGELDPHGADFRGNPMGGLVYSTDFSNNGSYEQIKEWTNFMGGGVFCMKICKPDDPDAFKYCEHRLDRIGCAYNAPNNAKDKVFETCDGDSYMPGVYTSNGATHIYTQPPESAGAITSMPYTPTAPASSNCKTFSSTSLYTDLPTGTASVTSTASSKSTKSGTSSGGARPTSTSAGDTTALTISSFFAIFGVVFAALFLS